MPTSFARARSGFTLMELLVVISVIVVLAGMLMAGIAVARNASRKAQTKALIQNIEGAIERYRGLNASYPEQFDLDDDGTITSRSAPDVPSDEEVGDAEADSSGKNNIILREVLASVDGELFGPTSKHVKSGLITDIWGSPINYRPFIAYPYTSGEADTYGSGKPNPDAEFNPPNPDTFQLWSNGPDAINDRGDGDDLTNW